MYINICRRFQIRLVGADPIRLCSCYGCSPTLSLTLKNLGALYKRQGKLEAASALENIASQQTPGQTVSKVKSFLNLMGPWGGAGLCSLSPQPDTS